MFVLIQLMEVKSMDVIPIMYFYLGIVALIATIMAVIVSESGAGRIFFTVLAAAAFFYGGFALLGDVFNMPAVVVYGLAGICILGTIAYAVMNAKAIVANAEPSEPETLNLTKEHAA
jgi:hypothetical protein